MPKVSEEHIQARRRQIKQAAFTCFARNGIHRTTMQDVFAESGLSPGSVYTYFEGKNDILRGIADDVFGRIREELDDDASLPEVLESLLRVFDFLRDEGERDESMRFFMMMWGESLREPYILDLIHRVVDFERDRIAGAVRRAQRRREVSRSVDAEALARTFMALFHGLILQVAWYPDMDVDAYRKAARKLVGDLR